MTNTTTTTAWDSTANTRTPASTRHAEMAERDMFRRSYNELRRFASMCAPVGVEPDDLVQEALARTLATHALADLDNPQAYLTRVILNLAVDIHRRNAKERATPAQGNGHHLDTYPSDVQALASLRPEDRAAVYVVDIERVPYRDAARLLGCSVASLRSRTIRARRRLARLLDTQGAPS